MKRTLNYIAFCFLAISSISCSTELDNYAEPNATLKGTVINASTGEPLQTEVGDGGTRIKLMETSWSENPTPLYLYSKQDGTFNNDKIFAATYEATVEGAFVPLVQTNAEGEVVVDNSKVVEVGDGEEVTVNFEVEPFMNVEWVGEPVMTEDGNISVQFVVTRGTSNPDFQPNLNALFLFVGPTQYLGNNNWDNRYSYAAVYGGTSGDELLGEVITLTTRGGPLPGNRDYYVRVGARTNYGLQQYNYNEPLRVSVP